MKTFGVCLVVGALSASCFAQGAPPVKVRQSPMMIDELQGALTKQEPLIQARQQRIRDELAAMDRTKLKDDDWAKEWAGTYYTGDGLGENVDLSLAPKAGIAFLNYGCMGLYGGDEGDIVEALPDGLKLKLTFGAPRGSFLSERIYFVKWGKSRFLVPDWQMTDVVNNYNQGGYSRSGMHGIARLVPPGEHARMFGGTAPAGRPKLPPPYDKMLIDEPISLKVTSVDVPTVRHVTGPVQGHSTRITFEGGTDKGVFDGMTFQYPADDFASFGEVRIIDVNATSCIGEITTFLSGEEKPKFPVVGEIVKTGKIDAKTPPEIVRPEPDK